MGKISFPFGWMEFWAHRVFYAYYRFFGLSKGTTYIHLEMISKMFIILFLICLWREVSKTNQKDFSNKCPRIFSTWPYWRKEVFFVRGWQEWCKVRLPQIALSFNPHKHTTWIPRWNDVKTTVSTWFQRRIHVVFL